MHLQNVPVAWLRTSALGWLQHQELQIELMWNHGAQIYYSSADEIWHTDVYGAGLGICVSCRRWRLLHHVPAWNPARHTGSSSSLLTGSSGVRELNQSCANIGPRWLTVAPVPCTVDTHPEIPEVVYGWDGITPLRNVVAENQIKTWGSEYICIDEKSHHYSQRLINCLVDICSVTFHVEDLILDWYAKHITLHHILLSFRGGK